MLQLKHIVILTCILCNFSIKTLIKNGQHNLTNKCVRQDTSNLMKLSKEKCNTNVWNFQSAPFTIQLKVQYEIQVK